MFGFTKLLWFYFCVGHISQLVEATIDLTLPEVEHLANHLTKDECHKLIAALHFDTFKLSQAVENAENAGMLSVLLHQYKLYIVKDWPTCDCVVEW